MRPRHFAWSNGLALEDVRRHRRAAQRVVAENQLEQRRQTESRVHGIGLVVEIDDPDVPQVVVVTGEGELSPVTRREIAVKPVWPPDIRTRAADVDAEDGVLRGVHQGEVLRTGKCGADSEHGHEQKRDKPDLLHFLFLFVCCLFCC